jgi:hypothetical protein
VVHQFIIRIPQRWQAVKIRIRHSKTTIKKIGLKDGPDLDAVEAAVSMVGQMLINIEQFFFCWLFISRKSVYNKIPQKVLKKRSPW